MSDYTHTPVLLNEVLSALQPKPGGVYIDATVGGGGHAAALLHQAQPGGRMLGVDADPTALQAAQKHFALRWPDSNGSDGAVTYTLCHSSFEHLRELAQAHNFDPVDGIVFDLGVSSHQIDTPARGFSFHADGPLDMRLDPTQGQTAEDLVANLDEQALANLIYQYGEERASRRIARFIVNQRQQQPVTSTGKLAAIVAQALRSSSKRRAAIHPATRTFQALRIAVNRELEQLDAVLPQAVTLLRPGGRLAVISFHSLEDRIVKQFFRAESGYGGSEAPDRPVRLRIITKKPIEPGDAEVRANPRSRSARLRVAERVGNT